MKKQIVSLGCAVLLAAIQGAAARTTWDIGEPIVTYWAGPGYHGSNVPITDESLKLLKEGGFNMAWASTLEELDLIHKWGLRALFYLDLPRGGRLTNDKKAAFEEMIKRVKNHPALYIYHRCDEPPAGWFEDLAFDSEALRKVDNTHAMWVNLLPTYANNKQLGVPGEIIYAYWEHVRRYIEVCDPDFVSYDHYQFNNGWDTSNYFLNLAIIREACAARGIPFMNGVQACTWVAPKNFASPAAPRIPGSDELRYLVYTTLAYGAQGIYYYVYTYPHHTGTIVSETGVPSEKYYTLKKLNPIFVATAKELRGYKMEGAFFKGYYPPGGTPYSPRALLTFSDGAQSESLPPKSEFTNSVLVTRFEAPGRRTRLMVVNLDYRKEVTLDLKAPRPVTRFWPESKTWIAIGDRSTFTLSLTKGEGALLEVIE